jgi:hypothetical protein
VEADQLSLTQAQIRLFVRRYPDWLKKGGNGTFFLFKVGSEFFKILPIIRKVTRLAANI